MKKILILGIVIALLLALTACSGGENKVLAAEKPADKDTVRTVDAFGIVKAKEIKNIIIDFPSEVEKVEVKEGQKVKKGDVLITLNKSEYELQIMTKELELRTQKKDLATKQNFAANNSDPDVRKLYNDQKNAEDLYNKAVKELEDKQKLLNSGSMSQFDFDEFKKSVDSDKKAVDDAKFAIDSATLNKSTEVDQKSTGVSTLDSEIKIMKDKLAKSYIDGNNIVSDLQNGVVYEIGYLQGDITTNDRKALSILDLNSIIIEANVDEEFIKDVKPGAQVTINPLADKSKDYKGKVTRISDKAIQKNGETYIPVEITFDNIDSFILPDFNVDVKIKM